MTCTVVAMAMTAIVVAAPSWSTAQSNGTGRAHRGRGRSGDAAEVPPCSDDGTPHCHGWTSWGTRQNVSSESFKCRAGVPSIPKAFGGPAPSWPTHYLYCNVVADGTAAGTPRQAQFGQLVPQLMIGNVEVCRGINHSAEGPGTHRLTAAWLAQAQYYFVDVRTGAPKCVGGAIVPVASGQRVYMSTVFGPTGAVLSIGVVDGNATARSDLTVASPQLNPTLSWEPFVRNGWLRPYVSFEAWDAPASNESKYPSGRWTVDVDAVGSGWGLWTPFSTGMAARSVTPLSAAWTYRNAPQSLH